MHATSRGTANSEILNKPWNHKRARTSKMLESKFESGASNSMNSSITPNDNDEKFSIE